MPAQLEPHASRAGGTVADSEVVGRWLSQLGDPDASAAAREALLPLVYDELRAIAGRLMARERAHHTLQPTALVHEAWVRLAGAEGAPDDRARFRALAATVMRHVLVDHARARTAAKRGGDAVRVTMDDARMRDPHEDPVGDGLEILALHEALEALAAEDARCARVAELRVFAEASPAEIAAELEVAVSTVHDEWRYARAWLRRALSDGGP